MSGLQANQMRMIGALADIAMERSKERAQAAEERLNDQMLFTGIAKVMRIIPQDNPQPSSGTSAQPIEYVQGIKMAVENSALPDNAIVDNQPRDKGGRAFASPVAWESSFDV